MSSEQPLTEYERERARLVTLGLAAGLSWPVAREAARLVLEDRRR